MDIYSYGNGIELVLQKHPIRLLYVKQNGRYVTRKYVTSAEFENNEEAFFIENPETSETVMYCNFTDEQAEMLQKRLQFLTDTSTEIPHLFDLLDEMEEEFKDMHQNYGTEWYSYSVDDREALKGGWHANLLRETDVRNVEEVAERLPQIIKKSWLLYSGLKFAWKSIPGWKEIKIFDSWATIIRNAYQRKRNENNETTFITQHKKNAVETEVYSYHTGVQLVVQKIPNRCLYVKRKDEFVTHKFITNALLEEDTSYFLENSYDGKPIILINYSDDILEKVKSELQKINEQSPQLFDIMGIIDAIEADFTDRRGLRQEWEGAFDESEQSTIKLSWAKAIAKEVDLRNVEKAVKTIPIMIKDGMCRYGNLDHQWTHIDGDIEDEILNTWGSIVKEALNVN